MCGMLKEKNLLYEGSIRAHRMSMTGSMFVCIKRILFLVFEGNKTVNASANVYAKQKW